MAWQWIQWRQQSGKMPEGASGFLNKNSEPPVPSGGTFEISIEAPEGAGSSLNKKMFLLDKPKQVK